MTEINKKKALVKYIKLSSNIGLSPLRSGNMSIRHNRGREKGFLISPSGTTNKEIKVEDIVFTRENGSYQHKSKLPSSEWRLHRDLYKKENIDSVVHIHSKYAVIASCLYSKIPSFHYMIGLFGGESIRSADYATFGTKKLSENVIKAINKRTGCLISNHGQITIGRNIEEAFELSQELELLCEYYYRAKLLTKPKIISKSNMKKILEKFIDYKKER
tara:strand:+ start:1199 stop:1849 length:651 start_codon:yes stop_codon:yes gene_type:complete